MAKAGSLDLRVPSKLTEYPSSAVVASPAGTDAIPITHPIVNKTNAGNESNTLANGTPGQILQINLVATGGTSTVTPATATGFTAVLLLGAKDACTLMYVDDTVGWILIGSKGTDAPPVTT